MDMLNKLKSSLTPLSQTVSSALQDTVYNTGQLINGVIPGNPVTREYEIKEKTGSGGPNLLWTIFSAVKKSSGQQASVWVLNRASLEKHDKQDREIIWEMMKRGVSQLTRLRHPAILTVEHPLEESRDCLAFATEPVLTSLSNLILQDNLSSTIPDQILNYKLEPLEVKYGLLQVAEGLGFLHNSAKLLHRNICLESIIVNSQGAWKISGFEYCLPGKPGAQGPQCWDPPEYDQSQPAESYPDLDYTAPEFVQESGSITTSADMFSFGVLAYVVHSKRPLYTTNRNWMTYKRQVTQLRSVPDSKLGGVPPDLTEPVKMLVSKSAELRPTPEEIQQLQYFQDVGVKTLQKLDSQFQLDNLQKSQFYKGLLNILPQLPTRVLVYRVYPCLAKEFVNSTMVPFILPTVFSIIQRSSEDDFRRNIMPSLKPVMKMMEPVQILLIFMQNMKLLLDKCSSEDLNSDVLPMLYRALDCQDSQIQELCLSIIPQFSDRLDSSTLRSGLVPRIRKVCSGTRLLSVRVNCLVCVGKMLEHMDKWQVADEVLPMIFQLPSREPAIVMATLGIFKIALNSPKLGISKELMANKVLPYLIPLSIENSLSLAQFESVMDMVKDMTSRVEKEQKSRLQQVKTAQDNEAKKELSQNVHPQTSLAFTGFEESGNKSTSASSISSAASSLSLEEKQRKFRGQQDNKTTSNISSLNFTDNKSDSKNNNSSRSLLNPSTPALNQNNNISMDNMMVNNAYKPMNTGSNTTGSNQGFAGFGQSLTMNNTMASPASSSNMNFSKDLLNTNQRSTSYGMSHPGSSMMPPVGSGQRPGMMSPAGGGQVPGMMALGGGGPVPGMMSSAGGGQIPGMMSPAGGGSGILRPSGQKSNVMGQNNANSSSKQLSMAEINDFLS